MRVRETTANGKMRSMAFENVDYQSLSVPAAPFSDPSRIPDFPKNKVPRHVGVIMDGNGGRSSAG